MRAMVLSMRDCVTTFGIAAGVGSVCWFLGTYITPVPPPSNAWNPAYVMNVKLLCGAWGDGVHDDTDAIQRCLDLSLATRQPLTAPPTGVYAVRLPLEMGR